MSEATDEHDLDLAIPVSCVGTHIDKEEENQIDHVGTSAHTVKANVDQQDGFVVIL